ncbi:hypothetical protein AK88_03738 [Plasmodium fragile]|uniref:Uncharacterized protein n=1 Tax=Plasmodium fragile TaxID=5857 RepID=A0A0D9QHY8_PLAFR|nr:uncharacterized protein AK88_03738 [Plasmodium fragile]KJP86634.1 hypothetical protein AK88_03738 [Plasmodium fragile]
MRVNLVDGEIDAIEEGNLKGKSKNGEYVQGNDESNGYTELGRKSQVQKDLTSERYRIRENYIGYKQTFHEKGNLVDIKMEGESNAKEDIWLQSPHNDTEHYNIMSSTETVASSNDSIADMYETNYKYFSVRKSSLSEDSLGSASDGQHNLKLDKIKRSKNGIFEEDRRILRLPKLYRTCEPLNGKTRTEENALSKDAKEEKHKRDDHVVYLPNRVYLQRSNGKVVEKNSISNFNPLVHVSNMNYYCNPCAKQNGKDNHFTYDCTYDNQNGSLRYRCHPSCEQHDSKCLHEGDRFKQNEGNFYMNKKCSLEFDNYLKGMYFTKRSYMEAELRKKCSHYFLPLRRPFRDDGSSGRPVASGGLLRKRESGSSGRFSDESSGNFIFGLSADPVDPGERLNDGTHPHGEKHQNGSHNLRKGHKCNGDEYHPGKNADHESPSCPKRNNLFSQLLKNLKLLGYAIFFCFFMSNGNKEMKEKQNSTRSGKRTFPHSSSLKSERMRKQSLQAELKQIASKKKTHNMQK